MALEWRTAWVTGASSGIGRALTLALARGGVKVANSARSADKLAELARIDASIVPYALDVRDGAATAEVVRGIASSLGPVDLAVLDAVSAEDAAGRIIRGLCKRRFEIAFPWQLVALMKLTRLMPYPMFFWYVRTFLAPRRR